MTFDNQVTIVGGRNIGDEYFDARHDMNYNDLDLLCIGPVVQEVSQAFDAYWNSAAAVPVLALVDAPKAPQELERLRHYLAAQVEAAMQTPYRAAFESALSEALAFRGDRLTWEPWTLVVDPPEKVQAGFEARRAEQLTAQLGPTAEAAQTEFVLVSPYFVPRDRGVEWLWGLRQRGLRVVIVTNSLYSRFRFRGLQRGVALPGCHFFARFLVGDRQRDRGVQYDIPAGVQGRRPHPGQRPHRGGAKGAVVHGASGKPCTC
jgi:cardiolipin synthase C